ncbi:uncharacterized protein LOC144545830 isoform X2 [Carex rostrata]
MGEEVKKEEEAKEEVKEEGKKEEEAKGEEEKKEEAKGEEEKRRGTAHTTASSRATSGFALCWLCKEDSEIHSQVQRG